MIVFCCCYDPRYDINWTQGQPYLSGNFMFAPDIGMREHAQYQITSPLFSFGLEASRIEDGQLF